jgi:hypothetical protein
MGPGRRDREKPWRAPASPLETLWYQGWLARAFAETPTGLQEFGFIPTDLAATLPTPPAPLPSPPGKPASEPARMMHAHTTPADDATTLLADLRRKSARSLPLPAARFDALRRFLHQPAAADLLLTLLLQEGILVGPPIRPSPEATRRFLELSRAEASQALLHAWVCSATWNDLAQTPGVSSPKGKWPNDPKLGRQAFLQILHDVPLGVWWDLGSFVAAIRERRPGFQRPGGDFESWYLQETQTGRFLRGFESWDLVEGALIRFVLSGPLHWLGAVDLGSSTEVGSASAFRLTAMARGIWGGASTKNPEEPSEAVTLFPDGRIRVPRAVPRPHRYQISRVAQWVALDESGFIFRLTPASLQAARRQGLTPHHIQAILEASSALPTNPVLVRAIERAVTRGAELSLERSLVLHVSSPRILQALKADRACSRLLGESLGPGAVRVAEKDWEKLCAAAARLGLLVEPPSP